MPNPNPLQARQAKKQKVKKAGDLPALCRKLWQGILEAEAVLLGSQDPDLTLRACHALSQAAGQYSRLLTAGEVEARLQLLEAHMKAHV